MSLADALSGPDEDRRRGCRVCYILTKIIDERDRQALIYALTDPGFSAVRIARALRADGHSISERPIYTHRNDNHESG